MNKLTIRFPTEYPAEKSIEYQGNPKILMIKLIRILANISLKEAKDIVDSGYVLALKVDQSDPTNEQLDALFYTTDYLHILQNLGAQVKSESTAVHNIEDQPNKTSNYVFQLSETAISAIRNGDWATAKTIINCIQEL